MSYTPSPAECPIPAPTATITVGGKPVSIRWHHVIGMDHPRGFRFSAQHMRSADTVSEITIHESVTSTIDGMRRAFTRNGGSLGVHFTVDSNGEIYQHADPAYHVLYHAKGHNRQGIGIEVITPYYPESITQKTGTPRPVISTLWADKGKNGKRDYLMPPMLQLEALWELVAALTRQDSGVPVPLTFPGCIRGRFRMTQFEAGNTTIPGVWAHGQQFSLGEKGKKQAHADGFAPALYCLIRRTFALRNDVTNIGNEAALAYIETMRRAERETDKHRRIIVGDLTGEAICSTD